jgi:putative two-component system response regulator
MPRGLARPHLVVSTLAAVLQGAPAQGNLSGMTHPDSNDRRSVPHWALTLSFVSLMVPVIADLVLPRESLGGFQPLVWLFAFIPALLLAYYRGWRGVVAAVAAGMVTLAFYQALATRAGLPVPGYFPGMLVGFLGLALGIGWLVERLRLDKAQVEALALTDLLTHLPNRRHARIFLENEFAAAARGRPLCVVLFDLDSFKIYNDRYGHQAGDDALTAFADILSQTTRKMNLSSRFGGEEFLSVMAGTGVDGALVFAERVRARLKATRLARGSLTVSAGVACFDKTMRSPDELLAAADHALYQAKREGRNRVRLFGRNLVEEAVAEAAGTVGREAAGHAGGYPRSPADLGKSRPPVTLLPHQVTGFGLDRAVLLVEDDGAVGDLLASYLKREGFEVSAAGDVRSAIRHLGTEFDVVITDLRVPGPWGTQLVTAVKARWPATQIISVTGIQDVEIRREAEKAGADSLLQRPFGMAELGVQLQDALVRRREALARKSAGRIVSAEAKVRSDAAQQHLMEGLRSLVAAVEVRDPCLQGCHHRVTMYAQVILQALDPDGLKLSPLSLSLGTEHLDIGMVAVAGNPLLDSSPGTHGEPVTMAEHTVAGRRILQGIIDDEVALDAVTWHHERWDGEGYPNGLSGESIPLAARIAAVADSLDALTSCRAGGEALDWEVAVAEIVEGAGTKFDPEVVQAFRGALPRLREVWEGLGERAPQRSAETLG